MHTTNSSTNKNNNNSGYLNEIYDSKNHKSLISWEEESHKNLSENEQISSSVSIKQVDVTRAEVNKVFTENYEKNNTNEEKDITESDESTESEENAFNSSYPLQKIFINLVDPIGETQPPSLQETCIKILALISKTNVPEFSRSNAGDLSPGELCNCLFDLSKFLNISLNKEIINMQKSFECATKIYHFLQTNYKKEMPFKVTNDLKNLADMEKLEKVLLEINAFNPKKRKGTEPKNTRFTPSNCLETDFFKETCLNILDLIKNNNKPLFCKATISLSQTQLCYCLESLCECLNIPLNEELIKQNPLYRKAENLYELLKNNYKEQELIKKKIDPKIVDYLLILQKHLFALDGLRLIEIEKKEVLIRTKKLIEEKFEKKIKFMEDSTKLFENNLKKIEDFINKPPYTEKELVETCTRILMFIYQNEFPKKFFPVGSNYPFHLEVCYSIKYLIQWLNIPLSEELNNEPASITQVEKLYKFLKNNLKKQKLPPLVYTPKNLQDMRKFEIYLLDAKRKSNI